MNQFSYVTTGGVDSALDTVLYILGHPFAVMWGGVILHFIKGEIDDAAKEARKTELFKIFSGKGVRVIFGLISGTLAYVMTMPSSEALGVVSDDVMNFLRIGAFAIGFSCESIAATMAERANSAKMPSKTP